jgi:uncharacterized RDD family membrane protein YckC
MEEQILDAPTNVERKLNYAGFWIRVAAVFIDSILMYIVFFGVAFLSMDDISSMATSMNITLQLIFAAAGILYFAGMESSSRQATLGKMAVGIKVGNAQGEQLSFANALGRYFAKIISAITLYIGFMMAGWDSKKQALHDKIAGTYVFYAK